MRGHLGGVQILDVEVGVAAGHLVDIDGTADKRDRNHCNFDGPKESGAVRPRAAAEHYRIGRIAAQRADLILAYGKASQRIVTGAVTGGILPRNAMFFDSHEELVKTLVNRGNHQPVEIFAAPILSPGQQYADEKHDRIGGQADGHNII